MASREREIRAVAVELDRLLDELADSVKSLDSLLRHPPAPDSSKEAVRP